MRFVILFYMYIKISTISLFTDWFCDSFDLIMRFSVIMEEKVKKGQEERMLHE